MTYTPMYSHQRADFVAAVEAEVQPLVDEAQAWAKGTLPGGVGTKSAKEWSEESALSAATAEAAAGPTYASTAAGLAATTSGEAFAVDAGSGLVSVYLNSSGSAVLQRTLATTGALAASGGSALVGFIQSGTGTTARTAQSKLRETVSVKDFGAVGDGVTNDRAALVLADAVGAFTLPGGSYLVSSNLTISSNVTFERGAKIVVPSGVTVTLNGWINAGPVQIFDTTGGGTVVIGSATFSGWAEWWGLVKESPAAAAANATAINAAITALRETRLLAQTYYTNAQISLTVAGKRLVGAGHQYDGVTEGRVTRIICTSATAHILYMGGTAFTSIANLPRGIFASDLFLTRSVGPDVTSGCTGLFAKWSLFSGIERIKTDNCIYGFQFGGNVHFKAIDCHTSRSTAGTGGADIFYGYFMDGSINIGANGGNASLYLIRCNAEGGVAISNSVGFYANQKMTDLFIHYPETSNFTTGIELAGAGTNTSLNYDTIDIEIIAPKLDTFGFAGLYVHDLNKYGSVEVTGGYYGAKAGATASVLVSSNLSNVRIAGGQFLMGVATTTYGVRVVSSSNVEVDGSMICEATNAAVVADAVSNCRFLPAVKNNSHTCAAAVQFFGTCTANYVAPMVSGGANLVSFGIQVVGTGDTNSVYDVGGIDSACINGGAVNKLTRNGVQIVAAGLSGTNDVRGPMT